MLVYPEIESWDEFYPTEIFVRMGNNEGMDVLISVFKMANIGATINLGLTVTDTVIYKKIGKIGDLDDYTDKIIMIGRISDSSNAG